MEHPIPLWVKDVNVSRELRQSAGFGGTNDVRKYDLVLGDWLPPAGHGKVADLIMEAHSNFVERVKGGIVDFDCYERSLSMVFPGEGRNLEGAKIDVENARKSFYNRSGCFFERYSGEEDVGR